MDVQIVNWFYWSFDRMNMTIFIQAAAIGRQLATAAAPADPDQALLRHLGQDTSDLLLGGGEKGFAGQLQQPLPADGLPVF